MTLPPNIQAWKGGFRARIQANGRRKVGPLRSSIRDAKTDRDRMRREVFEPPTTSSWTLQEAIDADLRDAEYRGASPRTIRTHESTARWLLSIFDGAALLRAIGRGELEEYARIAARKGRRPVTIAQKDFTLLRRAWRHAGVDWPEPRKPRVDLPSMPYFTPDEIGPLLQRIKALDCVEVERIEAIIRVLVSTGMRAEELGRLRSSDVDLRRGVVRIVNHKRRGMIHERPVTEVGRAGFEWLLAHPDQGAEGDRLFRADLRPKDNLLRAQRHLKEPRLHCRALRHTYGTALHAAGVPLRVAMDAMGHSTHGAHLRYLHAADREVREAIHGLSSAILPGLTCETPQSPPDAGGTTR